MDTDIVEQWVTLRRELAKAYERGDEQAIDSIRRDLHDLEEQMSQSDVDYARELYADRYL